MPFGSSRWTLGIDFVVKIEIRAPPPRENLKPLCAKFCLPIKRFLADREKVIESINSKYYDNADVQYLNTLTKMLETILLR